MTDTHHTENQVAFALWGAGGHARRNVLPALDTCPATRLIGLTTRDSPVRGSEADKWQCRSWSEPRYMLEDKDLQAIYIATPTGCHFDHAKQCLTAGLHVLCEKPLTVDLGQAEYLLTLARQKNSVLSVACAPVYHRHFTEIMAILRSGRIGPIRHLTARFGFPHLDPANSRYRADLGGGAYMEFAIYMLYLSEILMASPVASASGTIRQEEGFAVDTSGIARLCFAGDKMADIQWGYGLEYVNDIRIEGESGTVYAAPAFSKPGNIPPFIEVSDPAGNHRYEIEPDIPFVHMLMEFARAGQDSDLRERLYQRAMRTQVLLDQVRRDCEITRSG